ncbi:MAG: AAA family ATPase [Alphaproteobacteria bacterium]
MLATTPPFAAELAAAAGAAERRIHLRKYARQHVTFPPVPAGLASRAPADGALVSQMTSAALEALYAQHGDPVSQAQTINAERARLALATPTTQEPAPMTLDIRPLDVALAAAPAPTPQPAPAPTPRPQAADMDALDMLKRGLSALAGASLDEDRVVALIKQHAPKPDHVVVSVQGIPATERRELPEAHRHQIFPDVLACIGAGEHVYLVGPAGSGKTTIAEQVAEALGIPFLFCGALDNKYALTGFRDAHGNVARTPFRDAYENGGLFLLDEIDASHASVPLTLNAALANGKMDFPDAIVPRHPDFRCIAAANTFGAGADRVYVGRSQLDAATLDRFAMLPMDYDEKLEAHMGASHPAWVRRVQAFRRATRALALRVVVSPRATLRGCRLLAAGLPMERVEEVALWRGMDDATRAKVRDQLGRS